MFKLDVICIVRSQNKSGVYNRWVMVNEHLSNIYKESEPEQNVTIRNYRIVRQEPSEQMKQKAKIEYDKFRRVIDANPTQVDKDLALAIKSLENKKG